MNSTLPRKYLNLLKQFLSYPSISTSVEFQQHIEGCVKFLIELLREFGFRVKVIKGVKANPIIIAHYEISTTAKTLLYYGHYDIQPALGEGWNSEPFTLTEFDERLWGRGVIDNKGQFLIHLFNILESIKTGTLRYNIKLLIEGNEETGSAELRGVIEENRLALANNLIVISDGTLSSDHPVIEVSLRGYAGGKLIIKTGSNNVHSGIYGNSIPNALHELVKLLAKMFDKSDKIKIQGFHLNNVKKAKSDRNSPQEIMRKLGLKKVFFNTTHNFHSVNGLEPALIITGIKGGYIAEGYSNIISSEAEAKFNFRFPPDHDPDLYLEQFKIFLNKNTPDYVNYDWETAIAGKGVTIALPAKLDSILNQMLQGIYHRRVLYKHVGGSLPIITDFKELLGGVILSLPLANEDSNMHGNNENFDIRYLLKGLEVSRKLLLSKKLENALE